MFWKSLPQLAPRITQLPKCPVWCSLTHSLFDNFFLVHLIWYGLNNSLHNSSQFKCKNFNPKHCKALLSLIEYLLCYNISCFGFAFAWCVPGLRVHNYTMPKGDFVLTHCCSPDTWGKHVWDSTHQNKPAITAFPSWIFASACEITGLSSMWVAGLKKSNLLPCSTFHKHLEATKGV